MTATFQKVQKQIDPERLISRQHAIPYDVRKYAGEQQLAFTGQRGRGRSNVPSLCDIYYTLAIEGMALIETSTWPAPPVFTEVGQPENCAMARIRFDIDFDQKLRALKARADAGEFHVRPTDADARQVSKISLISLAVNLMELAIKQRRGELDETPFVSLERGAKLRRERRGGNLPGVKS